MVITVTVPDEFAAQAEARGLTTEQYVEEMIADQTSPLESSHVREQRRAKLERFFEEISANSENLPVVSDYALTRESFYSDHD